MWESGTKRLVFSTLIASCILMIPVLVFFEDPIASAVEGRSNETIVSWVYEASQEESPLKEPQKENLPVQDLLPKEPLSEPLSLPDGEKPEKTEESRPLVPIDSAMLQKSEQAVGSEFPPVSPGAASLPATEEGTNTSRERESKQNAYKREVLLAIGKKKVYPSGAKDRNQEGTVRLRISIRPNGRLGASEILLSSGYKLLDQAAMIAVKRASPFSDPEEEMIFEFSMEFRLE